MPLSMIALIQYYTTDYSPRGSVRVQE